MYSIEVWHTLTWDWTRATAVRDSMDLGNANLTEANKNIFCSNASKNVSKSMSTVFEILTAMLVKIHNFWHITPHPLVNSCRGFGGRETVAPPNCTAWFWRWRHHVRTYVCTGTNGLTYNNSWNFRFVSSDSKSAGTSKWSFSKHVTSMFRVGLYRKALCFIRNIFINNELTISPVALHKRANSSLAPKWTVENWKECTEEYMWTEKTKQSFRRLKK